MPATSSTSPTRRSWCSACCPSRSVSPKAWRASSPAFGSACMSRDFFHGRHAGVLVPLFSIPSRESWGIGEIPDLVRLGRWMREAGFGFVQLLPINEMAEGQNSPYSALSAMAIDPVFIAPARIPEVAALGGEQVLDPDEHRLLHHARAAPAVQYSTVRAIKHRVFRLAFGRFVQDEWL